MISLFDSNNLYYFIIILILVIDIYLIYKCYYKNNKEHFTGEPNIEEYKYLDNQISNQLSENINQLDSIDIFKKPNVDNIKTMLENELKIKDDSEYNMSKNNQEKVLKNLEKEINDLTNKPEFMNTITEDKNNNYRSIKSEENSQPINLLPLSNDKYLISLNGKCLESDNLNKNSIQPCNTQNPNQHFDLKLILNENDYKRHTFGEIHHTDIKYPFHIVKSDSGNCIGNKNQFLSVGPCHSIKKQRWIASEKPVLCT